MARLDESPLRIDGRRVLVVEDEFLIAMELAAGLEAAGATVLGPTPSVTAALAMLERAAELDGAVLDVNVRGETVFPVAQVLEERRVPFVFATGYDALALPGRYAGVPCCQKPVDVRQLLRLLFL